MRVFLTGGTGVLGRATRPLLAAAGHDVDAPGRSALDLFDPAAVGRAVRDADAILHLATRIPTGPDAGSPEAWSENDRLRAEGTRILVDAGLAGNASVYVQPTVTFVYPPGEGDESTAVGEVAPNLRSALAAEAEALRFGGSRQGVVLRLGLLWGPGTGNLAPDDRFGATLHVADAGAALVASLGIPTGVYNVVADGEPIRNGRFERATGWRPVHGG